MFLPTVHTPCYLPDVMDNDPLESVESAWAYLAGWRSEYEEQQTGYEDRPDYTSGRKVLELLSEGKIAEAMELAAAETDGQIISIAVDREAGTGEVMLQTSLTWTEDHSLPEVFSVTRTEETR